MLSLPIILALVAEASAWTEISSKSFMFKNIDPIVIPGQYKSHMHTFFGSDAVTVNTTTSEQLRKGCTTAENPNDLSVYWVPTLFYTGGKTYQPIAPYRFSAYYEGLADAEIPIPENYRKVIGSSKATKQSDLNPYTAMQWYCEGDPAETKDAGAFPSKTCSTHLQHLLFFPDCVNPANLSSTAYSGTQNWNATFKSANRCPPNMKRFAALKLSIRYDVRSVIPQGWNGPAPLALASGSSYSGHADFMNGWDVAAAKNMLVVKDNKVFVSMNGTRGLGSAGAPKCTAKDADPTHGTNDYAQSLVDMGIKKRATLFKA